MDKSLKLCLLLLLVLIVLIAVAPFTRKPDANKIANIGPPPITGVLAAACPLTTIESLIDSKQIQGIDAGASQMCMRLSVADKLWVKLDQKDRRGLVLAIECATASDGKRSACLEVYSQNTGLLIASVKKGKVTLSR
jgi:hypothetical protein